MRVRRGFRLALIVAVATLLAQGKSMAGRPSPGAATPAPEIQSSVWINGGPTSLAALRGKVVLVEFWTHG
ncbi:MAG: hypothetical protein ACHQ7N_02975 [Candidatus Methylomirabilales bacterium]